jgi:hypothetical protein
VDVADYQIAHLNLASSDLNYALKSNFPFYTEQFSPLSEIPNVRPPDATGESSETQEAVKPKLNVGASQGRRYSKGLERPGFIHPSPEPLIASMDKQKLMKEEIRQLVNLAVTNIEPIQASAESKEIDERGLEAGLSYIGMELQFGERQIGEIWSEYEGSTSYPTINYPENYSLKDDADRRREAKELNELKDNVPSPTYQKEIVKQIATITVGPKVPLDELKKIHSEIDGAANVATDPKTIKEDHEAGFVSTATASKLRGYDEKEAAAAKTDHAERLARIKAAQQDATARGVDDEGMNPDASKDEKKDKPVRGEQNG